MDESRNRAQKSVEIENGTQDLRVFSFACYQLSHMSRSESEGLEGGQVGLEPSKEFDGRRGKAMKLF